MRWGLIGCGKHGGRYLEPKNGGGRIVHMMTRGAPPGWTNASAPAGKYITNSVDALFQKVDAVIIAAPPAVHAEFAIRSLEAGKAVLLEKPIALTWPEARAVLDAADRPGAPPLLVASPHLYARRFLELCGGPDSTVVWCGPERDDGSCPGYLDWAPHGWAMAQALGTERVITGSSPARVCEVNSGGKQYRGEWLDTESPMLAMVETLERIMHGGFDWRSGKRFTRTLYERVFANMPSQACGNDRSGVSKTST